MDAHSLEEEEDSTKEFENQTDDIMLMGVRKEHCRNVEGESSLEALLT